MSRSSSDPAVAAAAPAGALADAVRQVHRSYPTGVTIVTVAVDGAPYGLAVNAFASISLEPPTVMACVAESSQTHPHLLRGDHFAVNVLAHDQAAVAAAFARSGGDKFAALRWRPGRCGSPLLEGAAAHHEVEVESRTPAHTHTIFIGRVVDAGSAGSAPLVYLGGRLYDGDRLHPAREAA